MLPNLEDWGEDMVLTSHMGVAFASGLSKNSTWSDPDAVIPVMKVCAIILFVTPSNTIALLYLPRILDSISQPMEAHKGVIMQRLSWVTELARSSRRCLFPSRQLWIWVESKVL